MWMLFSLAVLGQPDASPPAGPTPTIPLAPVVAAPHVLSFQPPPQSDRNTSEEALLAADAGAADPTVHLANLSFRKGGSVSLVENVGLEVGVAGFSPLVQGGLGSATLSGLSERGL